MKRYFIATFFVIAFCAPALAADEPRPNILFIYADDQPYKTIGCYPESPDWVRTPNIDKLATHGVRFTRCYLGSWCMPSRASLLTGLLPHAIESMRMEGPYPGSAYDPALCPFWPKVSRDAGYQTAQIGKWHTGVDAGWGRDWDYQAVWNRPKYTESAGDYYKDQTITFNGEDRKVDGYSTDNYTDWAVDYIEGQHRAADKPWYLWVCYGAIHGPTTPAERHIGAFAGQTDPVPADIFGPRLDKPAYLDKTQAWMPGADGSPARISRKNGVETPGKDYQAWIQQLSECNLAVDEGVGRIMQALKDSGQLENTIVVYTADQGFAAGEHGLNQKGCPYDAAISSPLIISWPGVWPQDKVCSQPVNSPDLVALFADVAGVEIPWKTHGRDIRPLVEHPETTDWHEPMLLTHMGQTYGSDTDVIPTGAELTAASKVPWWAMIRDGQYKYARYLLDGETEELYDLAADPDELSNLADKPEHRQLLETLRAKTIDELRRTDAGFVDTMPPTKQMKGM